MKGVGSTRCGLLHGVGFIVVGIVLECSGPESHAGTPNFDFERWPKSEEWVELTNHLSICYWAAVDRCLAANVSVGDFTPPQFVCPLDDYARIAEKLSLVCTNYTHNDGELRGDFNFDPLIDEGSYLLPRFTKDSLCEYLGVTNYFGRYDWYTNQVITTWDGGGSLLPSQVTKALNLLKWTVRTARWVGPYEGQNLHRVKAEMGPPTTPSSNQIAYTTLLRQAQYAFADPTNATQYLTSRELEGADDEQPSAWYHFWISSDWNVKIGRVFAWMRVEPVWRTNRVAFDVEYYAYAKERNTNGVEISLFSDQDDPIYNSVWYLFSREFDLIDREYCESPESFGGTNLFSRPPDWQANYLQSGYLQGYKTYGSEAVLKWKFEMVPDPPVMQGEIADLDVDGIVEPITVWPKVLTGYGAMGFSPFVRPRLVLLPLAETPSWYGGVPVSAYFTEIGVQGLAYRHSIPEYPDEDGVYSTLNLNTRILETGWTSTNNTLFSFTATKRVSVLRPLGAVVVFEFTLDTFFEDDEESGFTDAGRPVATNRFRNYVLWDRTPDDHTDYEYDLSFPSGVVHEFGTNGHLTRVRMMDGRQVSLEGSTLPGGLVALPDSASDVRGRASLEWDDAVLSGVLYQTPDQAQEIKVSLGHDAVGQVISLSKSATPSIQGIARGNASSLYDSDAVTYSWGTVSRSERSVGATREVELSLSHSSGELSLGVGIDSLERVSSVTRGANNGASTWSCEYQAGQGRYWNELPKASRISKVTNPDGSWIQYTYEPAYGWLASVTMPISDTLTKTVSMRYDDAHGGDSKDWRAMSERPREILESMGGIAVGKTLVSYSGYAQEEMQLCDSPNGTWGDPDNRMTSVTRTTSSGLEYGQPIAVSTPLQGAAIVQSIVGGSLKSVTSFSTGESLETAVSARGVTTRSIQKENGQAITSAISTEDSLGRIIRTDFLNGTHVKYANFDWIWAQSITEIDESLTQCSFDDLGRMVTRANTALGRSETFDYDLPGNLSSHTLTGGGQSVTTARIFDSQGRLKSESGLLGTTLHSHQNQSFGRRVTTTLPDGSVAVTDLHFDGSVREISGEGVVAAKRYEPGVQGGQFYMKVIHPVGAAQSEWRRTLFNAFGELTAIEQNGVATPSTLNWNERGLCVGGVDPSGIRHVQTYDSANRRHEFGVDGNGDGSLNDSSSDRFVRINRVVSSGSVTETHDSFLQDGSPAATVVGAASASLDGRSATVSELGHSESVSRSAYSAGGVYTEEVIHSDASKTQNTFSKWLPVLTRHFDNQGGLVETVTRTFDGLGALEQESSSIHGSTQYQYDSARRLEKIIPPDLSQTTSFTYYNGTDRVKTELRADGKVRKYDYEPNGLLARVYEGGEYDISYEYDDQGRRTEMRTLREGQVVTTTWDYDASTGLLAQKCVGASTIESFSYRDNGQVESRTDGMGGVAQVGYNSLGDASSVAYLPAGGGGGGSLSGGTALVSYDRLGRPLSHSGVNGIVLESAYSLDGSLLTNRLAGMGVVSNSLTRYVRASGHSGPTDIQVSATGAGTTQVQLAYGPQSTVTNLVALGGGLRATYVYGGGGRFVQSCTLRNATGGVLSASSYAWDLVNSRLTNMAHSVGGATAARYGFAYGAGAGQISSILREDGARWDFAYDRQDHLATATKLNTNGAAILGLDFQYSYDSIGNLIGSESRGASGTVTHVFTPNNLNLHVQRAHLGQVEILGTAVTGSIITVNGIRAERQGERFRAVVPVAAASGAVETNIEIWAVKYLGDATDLVSLATGTLYVPQTTEAVTHLANGVMASDSRFSYDFNQQRQLSSVESTALATNLRVAMTYDPMGRRVKKQVYREQGTNWSAVRTHEYHYDGWQPVMEVMIENGTNTLRRYIWGLDVAGLRSGRYDQQAGGAGGLLAIQVERGGQTLAYFPLSDQVGTIRVVLDELGTVVARFEYTPFGRMVEEWYVSESVRRNLAGTPRFNSKIFDAETELYYYGYRYYDPVSGKWLSTDPLQEAAGPNLTAFCRNDPVNALDPLGLAGYFFDGTANHPHPTNLDGTPNHKTNVRKLYELTRGARFYAYGIGSGYNADGTLTEHGVLYEGATGDSMKDRAEWMIGNLEDQLRAGDNVVDLMGFSRGAATATYFLNRIQDEIMSGNALYANIQIRFVALFDQVPSKLPLVPAIGASLGNGVLKTATLGMIGFNPYPALSDKSGSYHFTLPEGMSFAVTPLHLVALDEQRREFAVTDLQGALQIGFRGVHSDVGDGYYQNFFAYITRRFVYEQAKAAGVQFFDDQFWSMEPEFNDLFDAMQSGGIAGRLNSAPTDNSQLKWDDHELRLFPSGMILHPSVNWFGIPIKNHIP